MEDLFAPEGGQEQTTASQEEYEFWEEVHTEDGGVYYWNLTTGETKWVLEEFSTPLAALEWGGSESYGEDGETLYSGDVIPSMGTGTYAYNDGCKGIENSEEDEEEEEEEEDDDPTAMLDEATARAQHMQQQMELLASLTAARLVHSVLDAGSNRVIQRFQRERIAAMEQVRRQQLGIKADHNHNRADKAESETQGTPRVDVATPRNEELQLEPNREVDDSVDIPPLNPAPPQRDGMEEGVLLGELMQCFSKCSAEALRLGLTSVDLSSEPLSLPNATTLSSALKLHCSTRLTALYLTNAYIGDSVARELAEGLRFLSALTQLHLNNNEIGDEGIHRICISVESLPCLETLNVAHNPFGATGYRSVAGLLAQSTCSVRNLSLGGCVGLVENYKWRTISRSQSDAISPPGDDAAIYIGAAIASPHGCPLESLSVTNAGFAGQGINAISAALFCSTSLKRLDLTGNPFGVDAQSVANLGYAMMGGCGLEALVVHSCRLSREQRDHLMSLTLRKRGAKPSVLSWQEECLLGGRGSTLRSWLFDAATHKGFNYPRREAAVKQLQLPVFDRDQQREALGSSSPLDEIQRSLPISRQVELYLGGASECKQDAEPCISIDRLQMCLEEGRQLALKVLDLIRAEDATLRKASSQAETMKGEDRQLIEMERSINCTKMSISSNTAKIDALHRAYIGALDALQSATASCKQSKERCKVLEADDHLRSAALELERSSLEKRMADLVALQHKATEDKHRLDEAQARGRELEDELEHLLKNQHLSIQSKSNDKLARAEALVSQGRASLHLQALRGMASLVETEMSSMFRQLSRQEMLSLLPQRCGRPEVDYKAAAVLHRRACHQHLDSIHPEDCAQDDEDQTFLDDHSQILRALEEECELEDMAKQKKDASTSVAMLTSSGAMRTASQSIEPAPLISRLKLGARIAAASALLPDVDEKGLTVEQRKYRATQALLHEEQRRRRKRVAYSRRIKKRIRSAKREQLRNVRAARMTDAATIPEMLDELGDDVIFHTAEDVAEAYANHLKTHLRVRLHATSRWKRADTRKHSHSGSLLPAQQQGGSGGSLASRLKSIISSSSPPAPPLSSSSSVVVAAPPAVRRLLARAAS